MREGIRTDVSPNRNVEVSYIIKENKGNKVLGYYVTYLPSLKECNVENSGYFIPILMD